MRFPKLLICSLLAISRLNGERITSGRIASPRGWFERILHGLSENPALLSATEAGTPLRRIGEPEDIAGAAVFLASRAGAWMTGQTIVVDGGITISGSNL